MALSMGNIELGVSVALLLTEFWKSAKSEIVRESAQMVSKDGRWLKKDAKCDID